MGIPSTHPSVLCKSSLRSPWAQFRTNSWVRSAPNLQGRQSARVRTLIWHLGLTPLTPHTYLLPTGVHTQTERCIRPELTHWLCGRNDLSGQLSVRHAFNMTRGRTAYRSLTDTDGDRSTPKTSMPCCFTITFPRGLHSLLSQGYSTIAYIANRDQISTYLSKVIGNHPASTELSIISILDLLMWGIRWAR